MRDEDYKKRLVGYLKKNLSKGYSADTLRWALIKQGNSRSIVDSALEETQKELVETASQLVESPKVEYIHEEELEPEYKPKKSWWKRLFGR